MRRTFCLGAFIPSLDNSEGVAASKPNEGGASRDLVSRSMEIRGFYRKDFGKNHSLFVKRILLMHQ